MERLLSTAKSPLAQGYLDGRSFALVGLAAVLAALLVVTLHGSKTSTGSSKVGVFGNQGKSKHSLLLVGPMNSGKTSFFGKLVYSQPPPTHTSIVASSAVLPEQALEIVDLPGHPRLRSHLLAQYLPSADGVVFCIDPQTNGSSQGIQATAEHLHVVLSLIRTLEVKQQHSRKRSRQGSSTTLPVLILLTKSDTWSSIQKQRAKDRVKTALERELEKRRKASSGLAASQARLEGIDELPDMGGASFRNLFGLLGSSSSSSRPASSSSKGSVKLPEDEQEILSSDVLDSDGPFSWDEEQLGIPVDWAISTSRSTAVTTTTTASHPEERATESKEGEKPQRAPDDEGTAGFWKWVDERVR